MKVVKLKLSKQLAFDCTAFHQEVVLLPGTDEKMPAPGTGQMNRAGRQTRLNAPTRARKTILHALE